MITKINNLISSQPALFQNQSCISELCKKVADFFQSLKEALARLFCPHPKTTPAPSNNYVQLPQAQRPIQPVLLNNAQPDQNPIQPQPENAQVDQNQPALINNPPAPEREGLLDILNQNPRFIVALPENPPRLLFRVNTEPAAPYIVRERDRALPFMGNYRLVDQIFRQECRCRKFLLENDPPRANRRAPNALQELEDILEKSERGEVLTQEERATRIHLEGFIRREEVNREALDAARGLVHDRRGLTHRLWRFPEHIQNIRFEKLLNIFDQVNPEPRNEDIQHERANLVVYVNWLNQPVEEAIQETYRSSARLLISHLQSDIPIDSKRSIFERLSIEYDEDARVPNRIEAINRQCISIERGRPQGWGPNESRLFRTLAKIHLEDKEGVIKALFSGHDLVIQNNARRKIGNEWGLQYYGGGADPFDRYTDDFYKELMEREYTPADQIKKDTFYLQHNVLDRLLCINAFNEAVERVFPDAQERALFVARHLNKHPEYGFLENRGDNELQPNYRYTAFMLQALGFLTSV